MLVRYTFFYNLSSFLKRQSKQFQDKPAIWLNQKIMDKYRPEMKKYYYDPTKYKTYLDQLGIKYPTVR